jgi:Ca2+-binding RTX toxin-like protein
MGASLGNDLIDGGRGVDRIVGAGLGNDLVDGGRGQDLLEFGRSPTSVWASLIAGRAEGEGGDTLINEDVSVEIVQGSAPGPNVTGARTEAICSWLAMPSVPQARAWIRAASSS